MLSQLSLVSRQQSIQARQKKDGGVPGFLQIASLACLHHLDHVTAKDVKESPCTRTPGNRLPDMRTTASLPPSVNSSASMHPSAHATLTKSLVRAGSSSNNDSMTIWVDDWQIHCCGQEFTPGDVVSWTLLEVDPKDYADIVGGERAAEIDFREEHHDQEEHTPIRLQVLTIAEAHLRFEVPPGGTAYHPVPGTTVLVPAEEASGRVVARPGARFTGYLVTARRITEMSEDAAARDA